MAGGKESSRQKMIGMMYLVLTALLALNVSKDLLNAFVVINDGLATTNQTIYHKSQSVMDQFRAQLALDAQKTRPYYERAVQVETLAAEMDEYLESLKANLIKQTVGYDESTPDSMYALRNVEMKDNYDVPTEILIGSEPAFPKDGPMTALALKQELERYRDELSGLFDPIREESIIDKIESDIVLNKVPNADGKMEHWEVGNFYHLPLAACITNLTKIQSDVRAAENDALKSLYDNVTLNDFKFDTIAAKVVPKSSYVLLGEEYNADVFLAAFSRTEQPEITLGEYNSESDQFHVTESIDVSEGLGKVQITPNREGFQTYHGVIKMKRNDGSSKDFHFESEYLVAKPTATVAPTKMNVLYKGISNPIKVSAPGVASENLSVSITGGNAMRPSSNGEYDVQMSKSSPQKVFVVVKAEMEDGSTKELNRSEFRVKRLPKPYAKIGDIESSGNLSAGRLIAARGIRALYSDDFEFNLNCKVTSFRMNTFYKGGAVDATENGNEFNAKMKTIINALPAGTAVTFDKIFAIGDDGVKHEMSPIMIKII
ncbi:gliding motility protein GldM [bacterium]|nr:gliding motility protein GldM [bacterium]